MSSSRVFANVGLLLLGVTGLQAADPVQPSVAAPVIWRLTSLKEIGGLTPVVEGAPKIVKDASGASALEFNGQSDGIELPVNAIAGKSQFTIEILFRPDADGPAEQRFFHTQDDAGRRALIETRLNKEGGWWLDTYLMSGEARLPLIDPKKVHPAGRWYWAALRFDGKTMAHFVNGEKEMEGAVAFEKMEAGKTSVGVRLNRVFWFKGAIREVRFHETAIAPSSLQRVKE